MRMVAFAFFLLRGTLWGWCDVKPEWYFNKRLYTTGDNSGKLSTETAVKVAGLRSERRRGGSKDSFLWLWENVPGLWRCQRVNSPGFLLWNPWPVTIQHFCPSVNYLKNIPVRRQKKKQSRKVFLRNANLLNCKKLNGSIFSFKLSIIMAASSL